MLAKDSNSRRPGPRPAQLRIHSNLVQRQLALEVGPVRGRCVGLVLAVKFFHVQDLLKAALDWIGKLGPWGR